MIKQIKRPVLRGGVILAIGALITAMFVLISYRRGPAQSAEPGSVAGRGKPVVLHGRLLGGGHLNTARWKGKVIVVDFWGTWCPWCLKLAPYIEKLYGKYHPQGLEVVGVPLASTAAAVRRFRKAHPKGDWPQFFDKPPGNGILAQAFGISGLPTELVIDRRGILRHILVGYAPGQLAADVRKLLAKTASRH